MTSITDTLRQLIKYIIGRSGHFFAFLEPGLDEIIIKIIGEEALNIYKQICEKYDGEVDIYEERSASPPILYCHLDGNQWILGFSCTDPKNYQLIEAFEMSWTITEDDVITVFENLLFKEIEIRDQDDQNIFIPQ